MKARELATSLGLLALVLAALYGLGNAHLLGIFSGTFALELWRLPSVLVIFFVTAAAGAVMPGKRAAIVLAASLLQLFVLFSPLQAAGSLAIWSAFYFVIHARIRWWARAAILLPLYAAPFLVARTYPQSRLLGILITAHVAPFFLLRSVLYAYEATIKRERMRGAGYARFLLYLIAPPFTSVNMPPVGFLALHRGFRSEASPALMRKGLSQMALGSLYIAAAGIAVRLGLVPPAADLVLAADELNVVTVLAATHLRLARFFLVLVGQFHVGVGMMRVLGFDIPAGSDRPYLSRSVLDFWRRWNTYFRDFLLTLAYYPTALAMKRRPYVAVAVAGTMVFLLSGFAHSISLAIRDPGSVTLLNFLEPQIVFLAQGSLVVTWMVKEAVVARRRRTAGVAGQPRDEGTWGRILNAASVALTLSVISVILTVFARPLSGGGLAILPALIRPPW